MFPERSRIIALSRPSEKESLCERFSNRDSLTGLWCGRKIRALYEQSRKFIRQNCNAWPAAPAEGEKHAPYISARVGPDVSDRFGWNRSALAGPAAKA